MATGTLTVQNAKRVANDLTLSAATATFGDKFANDGRTALLVENNDVASTTLTITTPATVDGLAVAERTVVVAAGKTALLGPWPKSTYNDTDGNVLVVCSNVTTVFLAAVKIP